jgi:glucose/arabinose dehydrogenase/regulation of enolase protein 1 (concanavalin A-like superfamily)
MSGRREGEMRLAQCADVAIMTWALLSGASCGPLQPEDEEATETASSFASVPSGFADELFVGGLTNPTAMAFAPDGRLFVCEQAGALRVVKNGSLLQTPFLNVTVNSAGERGLLGVAFDPSFLSNHYVYVYYTATTPSIHNRVSRFTANGDIAVSNSETILLELDNLSSATNHNGGALHFGSDGKLYIAVGENANPANAQTLGNLLGKMLRINSNGTIPTSNPFYTQASGKNRAIWALGLRNPFTFDVQPGTGKIHINDVGQNTWEEINLGVAGANYGWNDEEGPSTDPQYVSPIFAYAHGTGPTTGCAITGGTFYNPATVQFPSTYVNKYFFADYCSNWIRVFDSATASASSFASSVPKPVDLKVGPDGALYYLARNTNSVGRIVYTGSGSQALVVSATDVTVMEAAQATFTVKLAAAPPANVAVGVARTGSTDVGIAPSSLTFTPSSWSTPQTVTVSAASDSDLDTDTATITVSATGLASKKVVVSAFDDDAGGIHTKLNEPSQGATVSGTDAEFFGEDLSHLATLGQFFVDGVKRYEETISPAEHFHYGGDHGEWDTTQIDEGAHTLKLLLWAGSTASGHSVSVTVDNLPSPWKHRDIGAVAAIGSASASSGTFTVKGSGANISGTLDEFHFVHRTLSGDGEIRARVVTITNTNAWAKAGVMIRETLDAGSKHASIFISPSSGARMFFRPQTNGTTDSDGPLASVAVPRWLRVTRTGNTFTTYHSSNGTSWTQLEQNTVTMVEDVKVGLAVSARNDGAVNTATFSSVSVTP